MSHMEDDDPPIKSHPASKEYRANYDTIDWGPDEPRVGAGGNVVEDHWTPSPIDPQILAGLDKFKAEADKLAVREYLADGGEPSPIGWYGVVSVDHAEVPQRYFCEACYDTGCVVDPNADESTFVTEADGLINCTQCSPPECSTCGAKGAAPCDDEIHETTGQPRER